MSLPYFYFALPRYGVFSILADKVLLLNEFDASVYLFDHHFGVSSSRLLSLSFGVFCRSFPLLDYLPLFFMFLSF